MRYNSDTWSGELEEDAYREGVDRVLQYVESIHRYDALITELKWAIKEGII